MFIFAESGGTLNKHMMWLSNLAKKPETKPVRDLSHAIHLASLTDTCDLDHGEKIKCTGSAPFFHTFFPYMAKELFLLPFFFFFL